MALAFEQHCLISSHVLICRDVNMRRLCQLCGISRRRWGGKYASYFPCSDSVHFGGWRVGVGCNIL